MNIAKVKLGKFLGSGVDGEVYAARDGKAIKISSRELTQDNIDIFNHFIRYPNKYTVKLYSYGKCGEGYWYLMDRLIPLSKRDIDYFKSVNYVSILYNGHRIPATAPIKVKEFLRGLWLNKYYQRDPGYQNIMKDRFGNYKFIDLETFEIR